MSPAADLSRGEATGWVPIHFRSQAVVTAVIVAHDGARWLPRLLASLEGQTRLPDRLVAVDTGSRDDSAELLARVLGPDAVITTERETGFGEAIAAGLDALDRTVVREGWLEGRENDGDHWVWILHDDMQLDPGALEHLLVATERDSERAATELDRELAIVGPKVREWPQRKRLLEVGLTVTGTARRVTGIDSGEYDQGQHDTMRHTLAVGSAGMLVRRSAWDRLKGFDPALPLFSDDLDLGWRAARSGLRTAVAPDAVVFHAEASARGQRSIDAATGRPHRLLREHAVYTVLANCRAPALPLVAVRLLLGSMLRAVGLLLLKAPREAWDELGAIGAVLGRPGRLWSGRRRRRATRRRGGRVRPLLAPWWTPYGHGLDLVGQVVVEAFEALSDRGRRPTRGVETGPVAEEAEDLPIGPGVLSWLAGRPMAIAVVVLTLASLVAGADLFGAGVLHGGALLPTPPSAEDWWRTYVESWHPVAAGSDVPAPPYVAVLAALGTAAFGKAWLVTEVLFGFAVPLTALSGYVLLRRVVASRPVAVWAAVTYGLLPVLSGAVGQGRLGTVVAAIVLPLLVRCALAVRRAATEPERWRAVVGTGLLLALQAAFVPVSLPLAAALALAYWLATGRPRHLARPLAAVPLVAALLLMPWLLHLGLDPVRWAAAEAGYADGITAVIRATAVDVALGRPGGPGQAPGWLTVGLLLAAALALLRRDRRDVVLGSWAVAVAALAVVVWQQQAGAWPGFAVVLVQGAVIMASAAAADGVLDRLADASFGWRQPVAAVVAVAALVAPALGAGWWLVGDAEGELTRSGALRIPSFMADAQQLPAAPRTLQLSGEGSALTAHLSRGPGLYVGQDAVAPAAPRGLTRLAARLVTEPAPDDVARLARYGVGFVLLLGADREAVTALDGAPGLVRSSAGALDGEAWRVDGPAGPVRLGPPDGDPRAVRVFAEPPDGLDVGLTAAGPDESVEPGAILSLGEAHDDDWQAYLDGDALTSRPVDGSVQAFPLPGDAAPQGHLVVKHDNGRVWWLALQALTLLVALVLAGPGRRRTDASS